MLVLIDHSFATAFYSSSPSAEASRYCLSAIAIAIVRRSTSSAIAPLILSSGGTAYMVLTAGAKISVMTLTRVLVANLLAWKVIYCFMKLSNFALTSGLNFVKSCSSLVKNSSYPFAAARS